MTPYQRPQEKPYVSKLMEGDGDGNQDPAPQATTGTLAQMAAQIVATPPVQVATVKTNAPQK